MHGGIGAYYAEAPLRAVSGLGATVPGGIVTTSSASPAPLIRSNNLTTTNTLKQAAGVGIAGGAILAAVLVVPAALGGLGYWIGGKVAPTPAAKKTYQWSGAAANIIAPGIGLLAVALIGAAQAPSMATNPRKRSRRKSTRSRRRRHSRRTKKSR